MNISTTPGGIVYREKLSVWTRLFIAIIGLSCGTMIPVIWIGLADWSSLSFSTILAAAVAAITAAVGLFFVLIALGSVTTLRFDKARRILVRTTRGPLQRHHSEMPFDRIDRFETVMRDSEDGAYPVLRLFITGEPRPIEMVELGDRPSADDWRKRIEDLIA